jgi:hypothetical protein
VPLPSRSEITEAIVRDIESARSEFFWRPVADAPLLPRNLWEGRIGFPHSEHKILLPLSSRRYGELEWAFKYFELLPYEHYDYRPFPNWSPIAERAPFLDPLCRYAKTGEKFQLLPIIAGSYLRDEYFRRLFADALCVRQDISLAEASALTDLAQHVRDGSRIDDAKLSEVFAALDGLSKRTRHNSDGSLARGGKFRRALCFGPTAHEYRRNAAILSAITEKPVQDIEREALVIGALK